MSHFDAAFENLMAAEGGVLISDSEAGGGANRGVSLRLLNAWRKHKGFPLKEFTVTSSTSADGAKELVQDYASIQDLIDLGEPETKEIYEYYFWSRFYGDEIIGKFTAIAMLNQAVHRGVSGVKPLVIQTLNARFGKYCDPMEPWSHVIKLVNETPDREFLWKFCGEAKKFYVALALKDPKHAAWLNGWLTRVINLLKLLI